VQEDGRKRNRTTDHKPLRVPARAVPQRTQPSAYDLGDTVERKAALETARRACSLSQRPHRPESRMRYVVNVLMWCRGLKVLDSLGFRAFNTT
jgi:hypothetical protein